MQAKDITPGALLSYRNSRKYGQPSAALAVGPHWVRQERPRGSRNVVHQLTTNGAYAVGVLVLVPSHADVANALETWATGAAAPENSPVTREAREAISKMEAHVRDGRVVDLFNPEVSAPAGWTWYVVPTSKLYKSYVEAVQHEAHLVKVERKAQAERKSREKANLARMAAIDAVIVKAGINVTRGVRSAYYSDPARDEDPQVTIQLSVLEELVSRTGLA